MISAREALALPSAQIRPSDKEAVDKLLDEIDAYARKNMTRGGCIIDLEPNRINKIIADELSRELRRLEWAGQITEMQAPNKLGPGMSVVGYRLILVPMLVAYDAADTEARAVPAVKLA